MLAKNYWLYMEKKEDDVWETYQKVQEHALSQSHCLLHCQMFQSRHLSQFSREEFYHSHHD